MKTINLFFKILPAVALFVGHFSYPNSYPKTTPKENYNYKDHWVQTDWYSNKYDKSEFKMYQKNNLVLNDVINSTVSITKNSKEKKSEVLRLFKKSTRIPDNKWHTEIIDGLEIHEGISVSDGALYRIAFQAKAKVNPKSKSSTFVENNEFSTASIKTRYLLPTYLEAHMIQIELLTGQSPEVKKSKGTSFFNLLIQPAYAQSNSTLGVVNNLGNAFFNGPTTSINNLAGAGNNMAGATNNLSGSLKGVGSAVNNLATSNNNIASSLNSLNDSAKNLMSAKNIAKGAAIAGTVFGVTSSLASMATHFLSNVAMEGFRTLFYEATGEFKPEERDRRLKMFESSMTIFKDGQKPFTDLTIKLNLMSDALLDFAGGTSFEGVLAGLQNRLAEAQKRKTEAGLDCDSCTATANAEIKQIEEAIKAVSQKTGVMTKNQLDKTCGDLDDLFTSWVDTEFSLSNARRIVVTDLQIYVGHVVGSTQSDSAFQESRKLINSCKNDSEKNKSEVLSQLKGQSCEGANATTDLCIRFWSAQGIIEDCEQMSANKFTESDSAHLAESARDQIRTYRRFSKTIADQTCDRKTQSCKGNSMRLIRSEVSDKLSKLSKVCTETAFAEKFQEEEKHKTPPEKKCVQSSPSVLSWLKNLFCSERSAAIGANNSSMNEILEP